MIHSLYDLIRQSLIRATIGAVISEALVATPETASATLRQLEAFDANFPLLLGKLPE